MRNCNALENQTTSCILLLICAALAAAFWHPQPAHADRVTPPPVPANIQVPDGTRRSSKVTPLALRTTSACPQTPVSPGHSSGRRPPCSTTMTSKSSPTSSAPTQMKMARPAPHGSTHGTRAPSGPWRSSPPPTPPSWRRVRFHGSCWTWSVLKTDQPAATSSQKPPSSSG